MTPGNIVIPRPNTCHHRSIVPYSSDNHSLHFFNLLKHAAFCVNDRPRKNKIKYMIYCLLVAGNDSKADLVELYFFNFTHKYIKWLCSLDFIPFGILQCNII